MFALVNIKIEPLQEINGSMPFKLNTDKSTKASIDLLSFINEVEFEQMMAQSYEYLNPYDYDLYAHEELYLDYVS